MQPDLVELLRCPATGGALALDVVERDGDDIRGAVLRSEVEEYPVVAGVPVLLPGYDESVRLLRRGHTAEAAAAALVRQLAPTRARRLAAAVEALGAGRSLGRAVERRDLARLQAALTPLLDGAAADPLALVRFGFTGWAERNPEAVHYFGHRFGTPRHLVALAAAEAADVGGGAVLDLGCGAGHLSWWLDQRFGAGRTVGVDLSLFELWAARAVTGGGGRFVCADAAVLPLATGAFRLVLASDMLSFVADKWAVAHQAARVLAPGGTLALAAVKSSRQRHVYAGRPLSPDGWRGLAGPLPHQLYADDRILARYLAGAGIDGDDPGDVDASRTVTLLAGAGARPQASGAAAWASTGDWPHAYGPLGVNPLLRLTEERQGTLVYERRFPSPDYADDNEPLRSYLPERIEIPRAAVDGDRLDRRLVDHLVASTAVVALPSHDRRANLPPEVRRAVVAP